MVRPKKQVNGNRQRRRARNTEKFQSFLPPLRSPTVNRNFTFPATVVVPVDFEKTTKVNKLVRVEDVVKAIAKTVEMTSTWYTLIKCRVHQLMVYALINDVKDLIPAIDAVFFDPITGNQGLARSARGDIDDPARIGNTYPSRISEAFLGWDGTTGTSAELVGLSAVGPVQGLVYVKVVVTIDETFVVTQSDEEDDVSEQFEKLDTATGGH